VTPARVSIVRCRSYDRAEVHDAVARAVELIGGAGLVGQVGPAGTGTGSPEQSEGSGSCPRNGAADTPHPDPLPQGERGKTGGVLLKPNLLSASSRESRVCTDPEVVRATAEALRAAGANDIAVGDSPGYGSAARAMQKCGYDAVVPEWVRRVEFDAGRKHPTAGHPDLELAAAALDAGLLVNLPKIKAHAYMGLTLAVKNFFGCVLGTKKAQWHLRAGENPALFARLIVEIAYSFRPGLTVVDGIIAMEGNGPGSGDPRALGMILAGDDPAAVDAVICRLLGFPPEKLPTLAAARELGLGQPEFGKVEVLGERVEAVAITGFRPAASSPGAQGIGLPRPLHRLLKSALTCRPEIDPELCQLCARCAEICPPKAIAMEKRGQEPFVQSTPEGPFRQKVPDPFSPPAIDRARCIRCFCCQEVCPAKAISVKRGWLLRLGVPFGK